jgi:hypothetical protein
MKSFQINLSTIIVGLVLLSVIFFGYKIYSGKVESIKTEMESQVKLKNALVDSIKFEVNKRKELQAEKLTLQGSVKDLLDKNNNLNANQKELLARIKEQDKKIITIAAALVKTTTKLDSIRKAQDATIDTTKNTVTFFETTPDLKYNLTGTNIRPVLKNVKPRLIFNDFKMSNTQSINFHWDKSVREKYPVGFSISNSNKNIITTDVESFAIPELDKKTVKPTGWQKFTGWLGKTGGKVGTLGTGIGIGYLLFKFIIP